jgi:uncharacterized protein YbjT (DUF2867 family)
MQAVVAGSTGLIGSFLLDELSQNADWTEVQVISRKRIDLPEKFKIKSWGDEFSSVDVAFCALGTTIKTAGSKEAFYKVDHDLVMDFAQSAKQAGAKCFVLVSSIGATPNTSNFYLKVKGEVELALQSLGFSKLIILQPSMLLGPRKEFRLGEVIGKKVMCVLDPLMFGPIKKYRGINAATVASAMISTSLSLDDGVHVIESDKIAEQI